MAGGNAKSFGDLLDELISNAPERAETGSTPTLQGDLLDQIERLQGENAPLFDHSARRAYSEPTLAPEVIEALDALMPDLSTDPEIIARELEIGNLRTAADFDRARRRFAFANHPDRLAPHLRERAVQRMSIANGLIDTAKEAAVD
ncbi:hypothetical protein [Aliihoeflea sp. PC F10.4]